jgi:hypothetical protein
MARWLVTMAGEERRGVEEEEHAHHTPRRMSGWHGGAVPAWAARGYPRRTSSRHHREHRTRRFHRRAHTHHDHLEDAQHALGRSQRGVELDGDRDTKTQAGSSHRSPRRGGGHQINLVEEEEGTERSVSPKVAAVEFAGGDQNHRAMVRRLGFCQRRAQEREGERSERAKWAGSV